MRTNYTPLSCAKLNAGILVETLLKNLSNCDCLFYQKIPTNPEDEYYLNAKTLEVSINLYI